MRGERRTSDKYASAFVVVRNINLEHRLRRYMAIALDAAANCAAS
jgi:hypothetical protein